MYGYAIVVPELRVPLLHVLADFLITKSEGRRIVFDSMMARLNCVSWILAGRLMVGKNGSESVIFWTDVRVVA